MFKNKIKLQSNNFFRVISLNRSETMFSRQKFHNFRLKNHPVHQLLKKNLNGLEQLNFFSPFQRWQNQYDQSWSTTTKQQFPNNNSLS